MEIKKRKRKQIAIIVVLSLLFIVFVIGIPLLINLAFKIKAPFSFLVAEWSAGDVLGFCGAIMVFLGTACLSLLALYQNNVFKTQNDRLMKLQNAPYFSYVNLDFSTSQYKSIEILENVCNFVLKDENDTCGQIVEFSLENMSAYPIVSVEMQLQMFDSINARWVNIEGKNYHKTKSMVIAPGKGHIISFGIGEKIWSSTVLYAYMKNTFGIYLTYKNINNLETHGRIICKKANNNHKSYKYVLIPMDYDFENE